MKINTDGVLLGALAGANDPKSILDIGTGTGVIALMMAQRFEHAQIDAVEIDPPAAETAKNNFTNSPFAERLELHSVGFEQFFEANPAKKYDLIVSNPPFYINSLKSPKTGKQLAKHADEEFFERLVTTVPRFLNFGGRLYFILPPDTAELVSIIAFKNGLYVNEQIQILSYPDSEPHRLLVCYSLEDSISENKELVIYDAPQKYSASYQAALKDFFTIF